MAPQGILTSSLLGIGSRWRVVSEGFGRTIPPAEEESVAQFVRRKFGHEILEYLVSPFVSGVYAGDPEKLSLRAAFPSLEEWERQYGSVLRGAMKSRPAKGARQGPPPLCSFLRGMGVLTETMFAKLGANAKSGVRVETVTKMDQGFQVQMTENGHSEQMTARAGGARDARLCGVAHRCAAFGEGGANTFGHRVRAGGRGRGWISQPSKRGGARRFWCADPAQ